MKFLVSSDAARVRSCSRGRMQLCQININTKYIIRKLVKTEKKHPRIEWWLVDVFLLFHSQDAYIMTLKMTVRDVK